MPAIRNARSSSGDTWADPSEDVLYELLSDSNEPERTWER
jgi:hypothetical protein